MTTNAQEQAKCKQFNKNRWTSYTMKFIWARFFNLGFYELRTSFIKLWTCFTGPLWVHEIRGWLYFQKYDKIIEMFLAPINSEKLLWTDTRPPPGWHKSGLYKCTAATSITRHHVPPWSLVQSYRLDNDINIKHPLDLTNLSFLLGWIRLTVTINVCTHNQIWSLPFRHRNRMVAERANRNLYVFLVSELAAVVVVTNMVFTEK